MKKYPGINIENYRPPITDRPYLLPFTGLVAGILIWILDAFIDVYLLADGDSLLENIFFPQVTELWMRSLVTFVLFMMGWFARQSILKHIELDRILLNHKKELEILVEKRTQELQLKSDELVILANQDPLTGLSNRRKFNEVMQQEYNRFTRHKVPFCLLMIDIDNFKQINDQYGHDMGDDVIVKFSHIIRDNIRKTDEIARWGGEELIIIAIETNDLSIRHLAENIHKVINSIEYPEVGRVTASIGVSCCHADDSQEDILKRVDKALYQAKHNGRDRVEYL